MLWTPSTKAGPGEHDENISPEKAAEIVGGDVANQVEALSRQIYTKASEYARERGIIIADTKFEFALDRSVSPPAVVLCDEVLTPDSSRFWNAKTYAPGKSQPSLDKQPLRDWLSRSGLKSKEGVTLPGKLICIIVSAFKSLLTHRLQMMLLKRLQSDTRKRIASLLERTSMLS